MLLSSCALTSCAPTKQQPSNDTTRHTETNGVIEQKAWSKELDRHIRFRLDRGAKKQSAMVIELDQHSDMPATNVNLGTGTRFVSSWLVNLRGREAEIDLTQPPAINGRVPSINEPIEPTTHNGRSSSHRRALLVQIELDQNGIRESKLFLLHASTLKVLWQQTIGRAGKTEQPFETLKLRIVPAEASDVSIELLQHALPTSAPSMPVPSMPGPPLTLTFSATRTGEYTRSDSNAN